MSFRAILYLAIGFGLVAVSRSVELHGDMAPIIEGGVSPERAKFHIMALVLLLGALVLFVMAGLDIVRRWRR